MRYNPGPGISGTFRRTGPNAWSYLRDGGELELDGYSDGSVAIFQMMGGTVTEYVARTAQRSV